MTLFSKLKVGDKFILNGLEYQKVKEQRISCCKIKRNAGVRVLRDGVVVYTGKISSLKRFKDDVKEVVAGYECGIGVENFNDVKIGDHLEAFVMQQVEATLD